MFELAQIMDGLHSERNPAPWPLKAYRMDEDYEAEQREDQKYDCNTEVQKGSIRRLNVQEKAAELTESGKNSPHGHSQEVGGHVPFYGVGQRVSGKMSLG